MVQPQLPALPSLPSFGGGGLRERLAAQQARRDELLEIIRRINERRQAQQILASAPAPVAPRPPAPPPTPFTPSRPNTELGSFFGSGVLENIFGGVDRLTEASGGLAVSAAAGATTIPGRNVSVIPKLAEFQRKRKAVQQERGQESAREKFAGTFTASPEAFRRTDFPRGVKGGIELAADPLNLVPFGLIGKAAKGAVAAGTRFTSQGLTRVPAQRFFRPHFSDEEIFQRTGRLHTLASNPPVPSPTRPSQYSGPLASVIERGLGKTRIVNPDDTVGVAFVKHETRKQQASQLSGRTVTDFRTRFSQQFVTDANGNITNVGSTGVFRRPGKGGSLVQQLPQQPPTITINNQTTLQTTTGLARQNQVAGAIPPGGPSTAGALPGPTPSATVPPGQFRHTSFQTSQVFEDAFDTGRGQGGAETLLKLASGKLRNPKHGYEFTPEQVRLIQDVHSAVDEATTWARSVGVDIGTTVVSGAGSRPVPRQVIGRMRVMARDAQQALITNGRGLGARQRFQHDRFYVGQEIYDAVANGVRYESDIGNIMETFYSGIYRAARDVQLARDLQPAVARFAGTTAQRQTVLGATKALRETGNVSPAQIKNIMKLASDPALPVQSRKIIQGVLDDINDVLQIVDPAQRKQLGESLAHNADLKLAREPLTGEMAIGDPLFRGQFFDPALGKRIVEQTQGVKGAVKLAGDVGDAIVSASATGDFSAPFIQGIFLLASDPAAFAKGIPQMFKAFASPETYSRYLTANTALYDRLPGLVVAGRHEFYAGIGRQGLLQRGLRGLDSAVGLPGKGPGEILTRLLQRFDTAFSFFGDYARTELAEGMLPMAERAARSGNKAALQQLEDVVNKMTGVFSPGSLIQTPTQSAMERALLFFAPRYTRSIAAMVGAVAKGDLQGDIARRSMAKLIGGGMLTYYMLASALNQKPMLDPRPKAFGGDGADFLSIQVGNDRIGIGSGMVAMLRFFAGVASDPVFSGNTGDSPLLFTSSDPGGRSLPDRISDNPLFRFWRSRMAPVTGNAWDVATGHDFIGNPIEGPVDIAKHIGSSLLPFAVESALLAEPVREGPAASIGGVFGLRTSPTSLSARRDRLRDEAARRQGVESWGKLNRLQQQRAERDDAALAAITERARRDRVVRGREIDVLVDDYFHERDRINEQWRASVEAGIRLVGTAVATPGDFRTSILTEANKTRRTMFDGLDENPRFAVVREYFDGLDKRPGRSPELPEDVAYDEYVANVLMDPELDDALGFNFREQERRITDFRSRHGEETFQYVQDRLAEGRTLPPVVQELIEGRQRFKYFYGSTEDPNSVASKVISARRDAEVAREIYRQWESLPRQSRELMEAEDSARGEILRGVLGTIRRVRGRLRDMDPELDAFLFRWGYTGTLSHPENQFDGARQVALTPAPRTHWRLAGL